MNLASHEASQTAAALPDNDGALLRRYAEGRDERAFGELVRRHLPLVYGAALRQLGGAVHRAEEVTQSVFTDLARKAASLARRTDIAGWLYSSTHFAAAKLKRAEQRRQWREQEAHTMCEILSASSAADADWEQLRPVLDDAMHELGEREREVILQRFFQGRRLAEVGEKLGLSEDAARMRVERALEKLRGLLARRQITSSITALALALANQPAVAVPADLAVNVAASALTSAGMGGAPAVSVFQFMSTSKIAVGVAGVVLALTVGTAIRELQASQTASGELAVVTRERADLFAARQRLRARLTAATQSSTALRAAVDGERAIVAEEPVSELVWAGQAFLAANPDLKRSFGEYARGRVKGRYLALYRGLQLSPDQIEQFENLMVSDERVPKKPPFNKEMLLVVAPETGTAGREERLRLLLGESGYARLQEFNEQLDGRQIASNLAAALALTSTPLTPEQAEQVATIVVSNRSDPSSPARTWYRWDAIMDRSRGILGAAQLAALSDLAAQDEFDRALSEAVARGPLPVSSTRAAPPK